MLPELEIGDFVVFTVLDIPMKDYIKKPSLNIVYEYLGSHLYEDDEAYSGEHYIHKFIDNKGKTEEFWLRYPEFTQVFGAREFKIIPRTEVTKLLYEYKEAKV